MNILPKNRTTRWLLIGMVGILLLLVLLYVEEDFRSKSEWNDCLGKLEAKGEVLNWSAYIPLAVPDSQNFFKAPKMAEWFVKPASPATNDLEKLLFNQDTSFEITNQTAASNYLAWSDQFQRQFDLIRAALKRPFARIDGDYSMPMVMPLPNYTTIHAVVKTLAQRAKCDLLLSRPAKALDELTLMRDICGVSEAAPSGKPMTLVAAMINAAIAGLYTDVIADGLERHLWQDQQLTVLQTQLGPINVVAPVFVALHVERVSLLLFTASGWHSLLQSKRPAIPMLPGFLYRNMVNIAELDQKVIDSYDPVQGLISPSKTDEFRKLVDKMNHRHLPFRLYAFFALIGIPDYTRAVSTSAYRQTGVNEAQIACALERYHLTHGNYPETLNALVPQFIKILPHDLIGGQPLQYHRTSDGKFVLYSIGWNETDDGGQSFLKKDGKLDREKGDWVWHYPLKD